MIMKIYASANPRTLALAQVAICLICAGQQRASATASLQSFTSSVVQAQGNALVFKIEFSEPVTTLRSYDQLAAKRFFYVDFYGVGGPAQPEQWNFDHHAVIHVKRLFYPSDKPVQQALRFIFYAKDGGNCRIRLEGSERSFTITARTYDLKPLTVAQPAKTAGIRKLVVLDPGHGGNSSGARTSRPIGGREYHEKDLVLLIARRMIPLFKRSPNLELVMTRNKDEYVSLEDRIRIADEAKGDLFVSIHLNASDASIKNGHGFEVYYLSDGSKETNRLLEDLENDKGVAMADQYEGSANLKAILSSLASDKLAERRGDSIQLCAVVDQVFAREGPFKGRTRGIKSAAFRVLMNFNMPAILVECGFIDNPGDAARLIQPAVQDQIATLLFNAINIYFTQVDPGFQGHLAPVE